MRVAATAAAAATMIRVVCEDTTMSGTATAAAAMRLAIASGQARKRNDGACITGTA
jgi:hypothetical protein